MSAFVVSTDTMDRCVAAILSLDYRLQYVAPQLALLAPDLDALGSALYALNASAVMQRYNNDAEMSEVPSYRCKRRNHEPFSGLKALKCLRYQCSEGEATKSPIYIELDRICGEIAESIVTKLPQYDKADGWG